MKLTKKDEHIVRHVLSGRLHIQKNNSHNSILYCKQKDKDCYMPVKVLTKLEERAITKYINPDCKSNDIVIAGKCIDILLKACNINLLDLLKSNNLTMAEFKLIERMITYAKTNS